MLTPDQIVIKLKNMTHKQRVELAERAGMSSDTLYRYMRETRRAQNMGYIYMQKLSKELIDGFR